jgi:hypothetical protein
MLGPLGVDAPGVSALIDSLTFRVLSAVGAEVPSFVIIVSCSGFAVGTGVLFAGSGGNGKMAAWKPRPSRLKSHLHITLGCAWRFSPTIAAAWPPTASALDAPPLSSNSYSSTTLLVMGPRIVRKTISALVGRGCGDGSGRTDTPPDFRCFVGTATARNSTVPPARSRDSRTILSVLGATIAATGRRKTWDQ